MTFLLNNNITNERENHSKNFVQFSEIVLNINNNSNSLKKTNSVYINICMLTCRILKVSLLSSVLKI